MAVSGHMTAWGISEHGTLMHAIGVGGIGPEARRNKISGQINWIGIGPNKTNCGLRGPVVTFDHFIDFETDGPEFLRVAPTLAKRMYSDGIRYLIDGLSAAERREVIKILKLAENQPPSSGRTSTKHSRSGRLIQDGVNRQIGGCRQRNC